MDRVVYDFEELGPDLARPPMAAMRALLASGVVLSPRGWSSLSVDQRWALARHGAQDEVAPPVVTELLRGAPVGELRLVPRASTPPADAVPPAILRSLAKHRRIREEEWRALPPLSRYVLMATAQNPRLLWKVVAELFPDSAELASSRAVHVVLARCEVKMRPEALEQLRSPGTLEGRSFALARASGVRAARRAAETFDVRADATIAQVELDWGAPGPAGLAVWQAHVSSWDGSFFAPAALAAAATAAIALYDIAIAVDPEATVGALRIADEAWLVGEEAFRDSGSTAVYHARPSGLDADVPTDTVRDVDVGPLGVRTLPSPADVTAPLAGPGAAAMQAAVAHAQQRIAHGPGPAPALAAAPMPPPRPGPPPTGAFALAPTPAAVAAAAAAAAAAGAGGAPGPVGPAGAPALGFAPALATAPVPIGAAPRAMDARVAPTTLLWIVIVLLVVLLALGAALLFLVFRT